MTVMRDLIPWGRRPAPTAMHGGDIHPVPALHREMNRLFDDCFPSFGVLPADVRPPWNRPRIHMAETDREYRVTAELPGLEETDVEIVLNGDILTLKGEKRFETGGQGALHSERFYGQFQRLIDVRPDIDPDRVTATFKNGC